MAAIFSLLGPVLGFVGQRQAAGAQADYLAAQAALQAERDRVLAEEHDRVVALNKLIADRNATNYEIQAAWDRYLGGRGAERIRDLAGRDAGRLRDVAGRNAVLSLGMAGVRAVAAMETAQRRGELGMAMAAREAAEISAFADIEANRARRAGRREISGGVHRGTGETGSLTGSGLTVATEMAYELEMDAIDVEFRGEVAARAVEETAAAQARMQMHEAATANRLNLLATGLQGALALEDAEWQAGLLLDDADWRAKLMLEDAERRATAAEDQAAMDRWLAENQPPTPVVSPAPQFDSVRTAGTLQAAGSLIQGLGRLYDPDTNSFAGFDVSGILGGGGWTPSVTGPDLANVWT